MPINSESIKSESKNTSPGRKFTFSVLLKIPIEFEIELLGIPEDNGEKINFESGNSQLIQNDVISTSAFTPQTAAEITVENQNKVLVNNQLLSEELSNQLSEKIVDNFLQNPQLIPSILHTLSEKNTTNKPEKTAKVSFWVNK
jgi:galactitol-specific phosphotransferase system IIB component